MISVSRIFATAKFMTVLLIAVLMSGCATPVKRAYAYDDHQLPEQNVGIILGYYGIPALLVSDVDGKPFGISFTQPHPVKIYVLPGERKVTALYMSGKPEPHKEDTLIIKVEPGHTYKLDALTMPTGNKMRLYAVDLGLNYKSAD